MAKPTKRWTDEQRAKQVEKIHGWKPWDRGSGKRTRTFAHEHLATALANLRSCTTSTDDELEPT